MNEHEAIRRMKNGDISGLAVLVERYQVRAVRAAYLITQNSALAEDVVQASFVRAYQRIAQFDSRLPFAPWFLRSVVNAAIQAARRDSRQLSLDAPAADGLETFAELLPDVAPSPDDAAEQDDMRRRVGEALTQLSPEQRAAVVLRYYLDLGEEEMATALAIPPGTVKWRLHAARKQLRGLLAGKEG